MLYVPSLIPALAPRSPSSPPAGHPIAYLRTFRAPVNPNTHTRTYPQIEASWKSLTPTEQEQTFKHLEELQKKDWKELSLDEKKAAYYVAFGPHGPREPIQADGGKTLMGVTAAVAVAVPEAPLPPPAALGTVPLMPSPVAASRDSSCSTIPDDE